MSTQIQIRRDTTANWEGVNPVLADGEIGFDTTANKFKVGNGSDEWQEIEYSVGADGSGLVDGDAYIRLEDGSWVASPSMTFEGDLTVNGNITVDGGQIIDPDGNAIGGGGGGGAWDLLEVVNVAGADAVEISGVESDHAAYKLIFEGVYSGSSVNSLKMSFLRSNGNVEPYHGSKAYAGSSNLNPPYGGGDDATGGNYIQLADFSGKTGWGFAMFGGEVSLYVPEINSDSQAWGKATVVTVISHLASDQKEYRHVGSYNLGGGSRELAGLRLTCSDGVGGDAYQFAGGSIRLLGLKRG
jgi:hypothetical protein